MALGEVLREARRRHPDRRAILFEQQSWSYAELDELSDRLAAALLRQGVQPGDRVALHFNNCPEMVFGFYACFKIGAVAVPLNSLLKGPELQYLLEHSGARLYIGQADLYSELQALRSGVTGVEQYYLTGEADAFPGVRPFEELLRPGGETMAFPPVAEESLALIMYTSGTTSRPKGVMHSHRGLARTEGKEPSLPYPEEPETYALATAMYHGMAFSLLLRAVSAGAAVLLLARFEPEPALRALERHRATRFAGHPVLYNALLSCPNAARYDLSSVWIWGGGGDAIPVALQQRFRERYGSEIIEACGMTEIIQYCGNPVFGVRKAGSIGLPAPGVTLRFVDEQGREVPPGEVGEIQVKSEGMMLGYWRDPEATAAVLRDGWLATGDLGRRDEDGYVWFVGRGKELIIHAGLNVSPLEVEEVLYQHPAVREAGVVGVPDPDWGEVVHAFVALKAGATVSEAALKQFLGERIAAYKVPAAIHFLPELPQGATAKIHRKRLREWAATSAQSSAPSPGHRVAAG